jgi:predicted amidohydrolase YtcJ
VEEITEHLVAVTSAGMQAGFHVIGEEGCRIVVAGLTAAAERIGTSTFRRHAHRLEHAEMLHPDHVPLLAELGVTASMQPMFDALWGGQRGMYEQRLGTARAAGMNRIAELVSAGVVVAFGSDAPVTSVGPWAAVRASVQHHQESQRLTARAAFSAHTRSGWRAVGESETGVLAPGAPAHYAVWDVDDMTVQVPDSRVASWSTDPRSGTPGLPTLDNAHRLPTCLRTVVHGRTVHDSFDD